MHSFALTRRYVVLTEFPYVVNPVGFLRPSNGAFIDAFRWEPDRGTCLVVIDRDSGTVVAEPRIDSTFGFHHVNAYDRDGEILFDLETIPEAPESIGALSLDASGQARLTCRRGRSNASASVPTRGPSTGRHATREGPPSRGRRPSSGVAATGTSTPRASISPRPSGPAPS